MKENKYIKMLQEISAWLSFNTTPSAKELADMKRDVDVLLNETTSEDE